ncbi:MAG: 5-formyltetrahydrofolate cyclo-ligase [Clostridium sp.]
MDKKNIRKNILSLRARIKNTEEKNDKIFNNLISIKEFKECKSIFIYLSYKDEIDTFKIIKWCIENNKKVFVPKISEKSGVMDAIEIKDLDNLNENKYGILEPIAGDKVEDINDIDLVILPGAAFDLNGGRIGYGGGYYDRYLKNYKKYIISLTYEIQILNEIPMEEHDVLFNALVSEKNIYYIP